MSAVIAALIRAHTPASTMVLAGNGSRIQVTCDCGAAVIIRSSTFDATPTGSIDALSEHVAGVIDTHVRGELTHAVDSLAAAYRGFADSAAGDDSYLAGSRTAWQEAAHFLSTDLKARGVL